jgi:hypothetical protein
METKSINEKFNESYFNLSVDEIYEFDKRDNGPINNVISRINRHCYGVNLYEGKPIIVVMYYINNDSELSGDLIRLDIHDPQYCQLLLRFCICLSENYKDLDAIDTFNTFQLNLRGFLEKLGFFTVTDTELLPYKGKKVSMMAKSPIYHLRTINKTEFYRAYINFEDNYCDGTNVDYVYLMVNEDTSLIKIGTSKKPQYREKTLRSQEPKINIIAKWQCDKQIEKKLHAMFDHRKVRGEWFRLTLRDLKMIEDFMSYYKK